VMTRLYVAYRRVERTHRATKPAYG
jgi:hypothetical protein